MSGRRLLPLGVFLPLQSSLFTCGRQRRETAPSPALSARLLAAHADTDEMPPTWLQAAVSSLSRILASEGRVKEPPAPVTAPDDSLQLTVCDCALSYLCHAGNLVGNQRPAFLSTLVTSSSSGGLQTSG